MIVASILTPLEDLLRNILNALHSLGLPWAWSIVGLTIIVRVLLVPLTVRQIHSMQNMQAHAPAMKEIQRKYKGDRQKLNEELMKFYKENNINPAASCLPLVAQLPVFIGLFYTLRHFAKHPPAGDLSWLHFVPNIAKHANSHWSGYVLLAIYVLSQVASTYFMSGTMQKSQRYLMMVLPFVFIPFILKFPTGLVLYWMTAGPDHPPLDAEGRPSVRAFSTRAEAVLPHSAQGAAARGRDAERRSTDPQAEHRAAAPRQA